jgi:hypothetical protein
MTYVHALLRDSDYSLISPALRSEPPRSQGVALELTTLDNRSQNDPGRAPMLRYLFSPLAKLSPNNDLWRLLESTTKNVGVGGHNREKENSEWFNKKIYSHSVLHMYKPNNLN